MVKVIKKDKSLQGFQQKKIVKACKCAGVPEPVAKAIASMIYKKVKTKEKVSSTMIKKMIFTVFDKVANAKKKWEAYKKSAKKKAKSKYKR